MMRKITLTLSALALAVVFGLSTSLPASAECAAHQSADSSKPADSKLVDGSGKVSTPKSGI